MLLEVPWPWQSVLLMVWLIWMDMLQHGFCLCQVVVFLLHGAMNFFEGTSLLVNASFLGEGFPVHRKRHGILSSVKQFKRNCNEFVVRILIWSFCKFDIESDVENMLYWGFVLYTTSQAMALKLLLHELMNYGVDLNLVILANVQETCTFQDTCVETDIYTPSSV